MSEHGVGFRITALSFHISYSMQDFTATDAKLGIHLLQHATFTSGDSLMPPIIY
jgi:hypothetical protein